MQAEPPITLDELMAAAHGAGLAVARTQELRAPILVYLRPDLSPGYCAITIPDVHPSDVAKVVLQAEQATMAAICFESWQVLLPATDEQRQAWEERREVPHPPVRPSQHPDRFDLLMVIGEERGKPQRFRSWRITTVAGVRTFHEQVESDRAELMPSKFTPLFVSRAEAVRIARQTGALLALREQVRANQN